jgi:hypothetical protein
MLCACAGYSVAQYNVTRVCDSYVPVSCSEQCLLATVEGILAAQANAAGSAQARKQLVATVVPAVVVSGGKFGVMVSSKCQGAEVLQRSVSVLLCNKAGQMASTAAAGHMYKAHSL